MNFTRLKYLLEKQRAKSLSASEHRELEDWNASLEQRVNLLEQLNEAEQQLLKDRLWHTINDLTGRGSGILPAAGTGKAAGTSATTAIDTDSIDTVTDDTGIHAPGIHAVGAEVPGTDLGKKSVHRISFLKYAAAVIILISGTIAYLWNRESERSPATYADASPSMPQINAPSSNRATLTLANGQQIYLDSTGSGMLAIQGNVDIQKTEDGRIVYSGRGEPGVQQYNTLSVPRGSRIASVILSDGTKVFLNAASSLTYPVAFSANERVVNITGEAYFEVAKDPLRKFVVTADGVTTEVLGTHFNINTYPDEEEIKVTLIEGSIEVNNGKQGTVILPGSQAALKNGTLKINASADIEQVMAWKNGVFNFNNTSLESTMRQLARWYDMEIVYPHGIPSAQLGGEIQKTLPLSEMLEALGAVEIKFQIQDKKLIVLP